MDRRIVLVIASLVLLYALASSMLDVIVYGLFMYYIARPLYKRVNRSIKTGSVSAAIALCIVVLPITIVVLYTLAVASIEAASFIGSSNISQLSGIEKTVSNYSQLASNLGPGELIALANSDPDVHTVINMGASILYGAFGVAFKTFIMLLASFYLLMDGSRLRHWAQEHLFSSQAASMKRLFDDIDTDLSQVFYGNILTAFIISVIAVILFTTVNAVDPIGIKLPYPILLGVLCGFTSLIPAIGVAFVWIPATVYLIVKSQIQDNLMRNAWFIASFLIGTAAIVDYGPNLLIRPHVSGGGKRIHRGLLMLAYVFGPITFGFSGIFLGPIILVVAVNLMKHAAENRAASRE
ncbi:MAG: AI-2E family transporter [Candidatus Altiarchaeota archaeon]|nr:AI-2E family transporter [Candidatus Altiarchaeota archaeon]